MRTHKKYPREYFYSRGYRFSLYQTVYTAEGSSGFFLGGLGSKANNTYAASI